MPLSSLKMWSTAAKLHERDKKRAAADKRRAARKRAGKLRSAGRAARDFWS
jgi:hypothetical protein